MMPFAQEFLLILHCCQMGEYYPQGEQHIFLRPPRCNASVKSVQPPHKMTCTISGRSIERYTSKCPTTELVSALDEYELE